MGKNCDRIEDMGTDNSFVNNFIYNPIMVSRYVNQLPFWRRFLARYLNKYKVTKEEYLKWLENRNTM